LSSTSLQGKEKKVPDTQASIGVACLGVTHPHASGRTKMMMQTPGVRVVGAADDHSVITPFTEAFGMPRRSVEDLLADPQVDAVLVHSKSDEMADLSIAALEANKAVLVEKPAGRDVADLDRLVAAATSTGAVCQVGYNYRYSQAVKFSQRAVAEGWLGTIGQARVHGACSLGEAATTHLNQPEDMGGALFVIGCHVVDLMLYHFGMPNAVNAVVPKLRAAEFGKYREDAAGAIFRYRDKLVSVDFFSWDPLPWSESWRVSMYGTNGVLEAGPLPDRYELFLKQPQAGMTAGWTRWAESSFPVAWAATKTAYSPELAEIANTTLFRREADAFLAAIRKEAPVPISAEHARNIVRCIDACYQSSNAGGGEIRFDNANT
jgi:predicted dehydrogenase